MSHASYPQEPSIQAISSMASSLVLPRLHPDTAVLFRGVISDYKRRHRDRVSTIANIARISAAACREQGVEDPDGLLIVPYIEEIFDFDEEKEKQPPKAAFPFAQNSEESTITPLHRQIRHYIDVYTSDLAEALRSLSLSFGAPTFPYDQWKNVLRDVYVDFDRIYGYDIDLERKVCDAWSWMSAFDTYKAAVLFAFPGREAELETYYQHIENLFFYRKRSFHGHIISYDRAVRKFVGGRRDVLFNEIAKFDNIRVAYLDESGVAFGLSEFTRQSEQEA
ncbi:hypothetical protein IW261DRAFT_1597208 [Armillaria novae-zelandiae]|uniref:Uncharacterized protein n=1 Tax=Armillaria novae-zelandiae TaxID=153914 RepID=A0AA39NTL3_9AGAR|nr:hypothetical protein IW261DRAFT_1597208 [Armillaria novae-zelandiae]